MGYSVSCQYDGADVSFSLENNVGPPSHSSGIGAKLLDVVGKWAKNCCECATVLPSVVAEFGGAAGNNRAGSGVFPSDCFHLVDCCWSRIEMGFGHTQYVDIVSDSCLNNFVPFAVDVFGGDSVYVL